MMLSGTGIFSWVALIALPHLVSSSCYDHHNFMTSGSAKEGYPRCYEQDDRMYITAIQRNKGSEDNLKGISMVKCCQPPEVHQGEPFTLQSADWEMSADRYLSCNGCLAYPTYAQLQMTNLRVMFSCLTLNDEPVPVKLVYLIELTHDTVIAK